MTDLDDELLRLTRRLLAVEFDSEAELDAALEEFESAFADPRAGEYIFHSHLHFDEEPTAEMVIERARLYRPFASE